MIWSGADLTWGRFEISPDGTKQAQCSFGGCRIWLMPETKCPLSLVLKKRVECAYAW